MVVFVFSPSLDSPQNRGHVVGASRNEALSLRQPGEPRWGSDRTFLSILREKNLFCLLSAVPGTAWASSVCLSPSTRRGGALIPFHRCGNRGSEKLSTHRWEVQAHRGEPGNTSSAWRRPWRCRPRHLAAAQGSAALPDNVSP